VIAQYSELSANFFIVGEKQGRPLTLKIDYELVSNQMAITNLINIPIITTVIQL
jgi:hypothetical protein